MSKEKHKDWQNEEGTKNKQLGYLLKTGLYSDCEFVVGEDEYKKTFKAHKLIMASASPVFEAMFFGFLAEKGSVAIPDVQPDGFKKMLQHIYTGQTTFQSDDEAGFTYYAANKYMIHSLMKYSERYFHWKLGIDNALKCYELGVMYKIPSLQEESVKNFKKNPNMILRTTEFTEIKFSTILMILNNEYLNISSEVQLFNMIRQYSMGESTKILPTKEQSNIICQKVRPLIWKIRFLSMSVEEFADGPCTSNLLTDQEKYAILLNLASKNPPKMPAGFNTIRTCRNEKK